MKTLIRCLSFYPKVHVAFVGSGPLKGECEELQQSLASFECTFSWVSAGRTQNTQTSDKVVLSSHREAFS